ncbi:MAG: hypothetical protein EBR81_13480 [Proteobacteria bacterium]|nr:hypothetical protein [Pseudomonadota bacterium]
MKNKHTVPLVRIKLSKDWVRSSDKLKYGRCDAPIHNGIVFKNHEEGPPSHIFIDSPHWWDFNA